MISPPAGAFPDRLRTPEIPAITCEGFGEEAFGVLERLRSEPHVDRYRREKETIRRTIQEPFRRFRDDLVVNVVLPNAIPWETERNVFSRVLKNDFGAGGCHHHLWMAFYRPHRSRLTDLQLAFAIRPEGFDATLFAGRQAVGVFRPLRDRILRGPHAFLELLNPLLQEGEYVIRRAGERPRLHFAAPIAELPVELGGAQSFWIRTRLPRADVLRFGGGIVAWAADRMQAMWPLYLFMVEED